MNTPAGVDASGQIVQIDPIAGMFNPSTIQQALHMLLASYSDGVRRRGHSRCARIASR
jgi:cytochrome bd-type quinol oxidase subunit 1